MGELQHEAFQFTFNGLLKVAFQGSRVTSDAFGRIVGSCLEMKSTVSHTGCPPSCSRLVWPHTLTLRRQPAKRQSSIE